MRNIDESIAVLRQRHTSEELQAVIRGIDWIQERLPGYDWRGVLSTRTPFVTRKIGVLLALQEAFPEKTELAINSPSDAIKLGLLTAGEGIEGISAKSMFETFEIWIDFIKISNEEVHEPMVP